MPRSMRDDFTVDDLRGDCKEVAANEFRYQVCPGCGDTRWTFWINMQSGIWHCHSGVHSTSGHIEVGIPVDGVQVPPPKPADWEPREIEAPDTEELSGDALVYLDNRSISPEIADDLMLRQMCGTNRVFVPFYWGGMLTYWTARTIDKEEPKYLSASGRHPLYLLPKLARFSTTPLILVEGVFDAAAVGAATNRLYPVGLCGKSLPKYLRKNLLTLAGNCGIIYIMLDSDALAAACKLRNQLEPFFDKVRILVLPDGEDPSSMHEKGRLAGYLEAVI